MRNLQQKINTKSRANGIQRCPAYVSKEVGEQMNPILFLVDPLAVINNLINIFTHISSF